MIRTNVVVLTSMKAVACRQKLKAGDTAIVIVSPDSTQPGLAALSKKTGDPVPSANTDTKLYTPEAFKEAQELTRGMTFRKQGSVKVTEDMFVETVEEKEPEEIELNVEAYQKVAERYTDRNSKLSYDLINKEFIKFSKSSSIVRRMADEGKSVKEIKNYIVLNKIRNIAENPDLTDEEVFKIVEVLDEASEKSIFKDLELELRKQLSAKKKK